MLSVIESELGKPVDQIFSTLERKATAAASLGQVHKGVLAANGATVAVKVQRPHIEQLVGMDLSTLKFVIWVISRFVVPYPRLLLNALAFIQDSLKGSFGWSLAKRSSVKLADRRQPLADIFHERDKCGTTKPA